MCVPRSGNNNNNNKSFRIMPRIYCNVCKTEFEDTDAYNKHLYSDTNNGGCQVAFRKRRPTSYNLSVPTDRSVGITSKRQRIIDEAESVLDKSKRASIDRKAKNAVDYSEFDFHGSESEGEDAANTDEFCEDNNEKAPTDTEAKGNKCYLEKFREYVEYASHNYLNLSAEMKAAVELMHLMDRSGGSLTLYEDVFKWHMEHLSTKNVIAADSLFSQLIDRYNLKDTLPVESPTYLPHSKTTVNLPRNDAAAQLIDILADPHITDNDYLFHDDNPAASPPKEWKVISDINTGKAYRETYKKLIEPQPKTSEGRTKCLCPIILYLDGCVTGQTFNLNLEILKFTIGILNSKAREQEWAWRALGNIQQVIQEKTKAKELIENSSHVDAHNFMTDEGYRQLLAPQAEEETPDFDYDIYVNYTSSKKQVEVPTIKAQDLHKELQVILAPLKTLMQDGLDWDLFYKGKEHHLTFVFFMIFVKCDGQEGDNLCGQYTSKGEGVHCYCRYCCIPADKCDQPYVTAKTKTKPMIASLVANKKKAKLKKISQHYLLNAFYEFKFGLHNRCSIHGATPMEILHWIYLGWFKYSRESLFEQAGPTSALARYLNAVAAALGTILQRQSDRTLPRTHFSRGVQKGNLMAHEMVGVILVLAATIRCKRGTNLLMNDARGKKKNNFESMKFVRDWRMLLENQLMFSEWLLKREMRVDLVERARLKVKELMGMIRTIGKRETGMGDNRQNFHGTVHVPDDILNFGVPTNVNTRPNEMHHKADKKTVQRTRRQPATFNYSVNKKLSHRRAIAHALQEIKTGRPKWDYYRARISQTEEAVNHSDNDIPDPMLTGIRACFQKNETTGTWEYKVHSKSKAKSKFIYDEATLVMIHGVCDMIGKFIKHEVWVYSELHVHDPWNTDKTQIYRASPYFQGRPWEDWAILDLHNIDEPDRKAIPSQMKAFIDLRGLPSHNDEEIPPGIYALIEPTKENLAPEEQDQSELFEPWLKLPNKHIERAEHFNHIEFVPIERILYPATVFADLDNPNKRAVLRLVPMSDWGYMFDDYLEAEHEQNFNEPQSRD